MTVIIIGNLLSFCAMLSDSFSGTRKTQRDILAAQTLSQFFYMASSIILKGYSGAAQNVVGVFRNVVAMKRIKNKAIEYLLIAAGVALGIIFNNRGLVGYLPVIANFEYSVAVFKLKDNERQLKAAFVINAIMFVVFNALILNIVGALSCAIVAVTTFVSLVSSREKASDSPPDSEQE